MATQLGQIIELLDQATDEYELDVDIPVVFLPMEGSTPVFSLGEEIDGTPRLELYCVSDE